MTGTAPTEYIRRLADSTSHTSSSDRNQEIQAADWEGFFSPVSRMSDGPFHKKKQQQTKMKNSSLKVLVRPHHSKKKKSLASLPLGKKEKKPGESRLLPACTESVGGRQFLSGAVGANNFSRTRRSARCSRQCEEKPNATETDAARRAESTRAGQNMEWSGCDFSCSHPGARTVLCLHASLVMSTAAH